MGAPLNDDPNNPHGAYPPNTWAGYCFREKKKNWKVTEDDANYLFKIVDLNKDGLLSLDEGYAWCRHMNPIENGTCCPGNGYAKWGRKPDGTNGIIFRSLG
jgi:hypothetical protein